jgi:hypothetical protein
MSKHDTGRLRAYLDGELSADEHRVVRVHLDQCAECAVELELLRARATSVAGRLGDLEAQGAAPATASALARFRQREAERGRAAGPALLWENVTRSFDMIKRSAVSPRWRPAVLALSALLVVALLFSIAPVRLAAADFLSLFRINKFAVIPLNTEQMNRLEQLARQAESQFGEPKIVREKGPEQPVSDPGQASSLAGYTVRTPSRLPEAAFLSKFIVQAGPAMHYEVDRATLVAFMQAAGASTAGLPQTDKLSFDVDVANFVAQQYSVGGGRMEFLQVPAPQVNLPEGIDPAALAETGFLFLGMPAEDAHRLATSIDWTSTLVVPLPTNAGQAREVTVDGVTGLLLESTNNGRRESALAWEKDGILYFLNGRVDTRILLDTADSLQ